MTPEQRTKLRTSGCAESLLMFWLHAFELECVFLVLFGLLLQTSHCLCINDVSDVHFLTHHSAMYRLPCKYLCLNVFIWIASNHLSWTLLNLKILKNFLCLWIQFPDSFCICSNFEGILAKEVYLTLGNVCYLTQVCKRK